MTNSEAIETLQANYPDSCYGLLRDAVDVAIFALKQSERKRGRWINAYPEIEPNPMFMYGFCSLCGFEQSISNKLNFCPNCGAEMEREQE